MRFIVVNDQGRITEITSNTPQDVRPQVRLDSIAHGRSLPLTPGIYREYQRDVRGHDLQSMDLRLPVSALKRPAASGLWLSVLHLPTKLL